MQKSLELVGRFVVQMIVAAVLFAIVASVATLLWSFTEWLKQRGVPDHIYGGSWIVAELLFWLDVLCFVLFVLAETFKLLRQMWRDIW